MYFGQFKECFLDLCLAGGRWKFQNIIVKRIPRVAMFGGEQTGLQESKSKKKQKSQGSKIVDKFIGSLPVKEDVKKLPKGLPSHWGPKVRHKPRPAVTTTNKKSKNQPAKRKWEEPKNASGQQVKTTKPKKRKTDSVDDFDRLVNKYKQNMLTKSDKSKWFDR